MVSTDGTSVTPDEPDPKAEDAVTTRHSQPSDENRDAPTETVQPDVPAVRPEDSPTDSEGSPEHRDGSENGAPVAEQTRPAKIRPKKPRIPRKQKKINRMVMEFQPDAVEMEHRKVAGGARWTLYTVILFLAATIGWAWWAKVDRVVTAEGRLISTNTFVINAPQTSPIRDIKVGFGDTVKAGQPLVSLDPTVSQADVSKLETRANSLLAKLQRLEAEQSQTEFDISGHSDDPVWITEKRAFDQRQREMQAMKDQYKAEYRKLEAEKNRNEADVQSRKDLVDLRKGRLKQNQKLYENRAVPLNEVEDAQAELKYARSQLVTAQNTVKETEAQFDVLKKQREAQIAERQSAISLELAQTRQQYNEVREELAKARFANALVVLTAPDDFPEYKVIEIADQTSVVRPGEPIMKLIPTNVELEVEVKVESKDIAMIKDAEGDPREVRIKLSAFPYMKHGTLRGYVKTINEDVTEEGQPGMSRLFYRVRIRIDRSKGAPELKDVPQHKQQLRPGMSATAEILVGKRRVIDYFIYPIFRSLDTSIREP